MRELDINGLRLCEYQARLFEESFNLECSTSVFIRRFFYSNHLKRIDLNNSALLTLDPNDGLYEIEEQFGKTSYGKVKASKNALFWIGYLYRYISYTREEETRFIMKIFNYKKLLELYSVYHTQDMEWCISNLLELYDLPDYYLDKNRRIKDALYKRYKALLESL